MKQEVTTAFSVQENLYLRTFPFIRRLTAQKLSSFCYETMEDITQQVMLKLYQWKTKNRDRELTEEEWLRLANTATQNEIKRHYANRERQGKVFFEDSGENGYPDWLSEKLRAAKLEGNTNEELRSLLMGLWKIVQTQTRREKYALLFGKVEIIRYLIAYRCCRIAELAAALELTQAEFLSIYKALPLPNKEIAAILESKLNRPVTPENIWKARQRARAKLEQILLPGNESITRTINLNLLIIIFSFYVIISRLSFS